MNHLDSLKSERSLKRASMGRSALDTIFDSMLDGMEDIAKTRSEKLKEKRNQEAVDEKFPVGFKPYNNTWRYEPVDTKYYFSKMLKEPFTTVQQRCADKIVGVDPFDITDLDYETALMMWGKGSGKDSTVSKIFSYQNYKLACLIDPQGFLGLGLDSPIDIVNVAASSGQAKNIFFKYLKSYIKGVVDPDTGYPWFSTKNFWWDVGKRKFAYMDLRDKDGAFKLNSIEFGRNITSHSLSSEKFTAEGMTILLAVMDEVGAMRAEKVFGSANTKSDKLLGQYDSIGTSIRRSSKYGKLVAISYKYGTNCPMTMLVRKERKNKKTFISVESTYDVRTDKPRKELEAQFSKDYTSDPEKAAMVYECKDPKISTDNFFSNIYILKNALDVNEKFSVNPTKGKIITVNDLSDLDRVLEPWFKGNDEYFYAVHADLAKGQVWDGKDACGLAMGHVQEMRVTYDKAWIEYYKKKYSINLADYEGELRQGIVMDLLIQITATKEQNEVRVADVRNFIIDLQEKRNFGILKATFDGWGSHETLQELNRKGIDAELLSVDKTKIPYETMKDMLQQGIWKTYNNNIWFRECKELIDGPKKVDHPEISIKRFEEEGVEAGSKELADCSAGVTITLYDELMNQGEIAFG